MATDSKLRAGFDKEAALYDEIRPHYPADLFETLVNETRLRKNSVLLEIGPGTGQATLPLAKKGYKIIGIELGKELAKLVAAKLESYQNVQILTGAFEELNLPKNSFDLIYSATAFHWIKPSYRFNKTHSLLKSEGHLAIIHANHVSDEKGNRFFESSQFIYDKYFPENKSSKFRLPHQDGVKAESIDSKLFELSCFKTFPVVTTYTAKNYTKLLNTYSPNLALPSNKREQFLIDIEDLITKSFNGSIDKAYVMSLTIARRK